MALNQFDDTLEQLGPQPAIPKAPQSPNVFADTLGADQAKTSPGAPPQAAQPAADPFRETIDIEDAATATKVKQGILHPDAPAAGRAADVLKYATAMHLPPDVVDRNFDQISARWKLAETPIAQLQKDAPAVADYMAQGPHQAALASADLPQLTGIEKLLRAGANVGRSFGAGIMGFSRGVWGLVQAGAELEGGQLVLPTQFGTFTVSGDFAKGSQQAAAALQEQARGKYLATPEEQGGPGMVERAVYGGVEGLGVMAPSMLAGAMLGPGALIGSMAAVSGGESYATARAQGLKPDEAASYGTIQATIAGATALVPGRWFIKDLAENPAFSKMLMHQIVSMVPAQEAQTVLADLTAWYALPANTDKPFAEYLKERPSAAAASLIGAIVMGSSTAVGGKMASRMLADVGTKAKESATHKSAPDQLTAIVDAATRGMTTETVYLPVKDFTEYFQGAGVDPRDFAAKITGSAEAYDRALATGEDLAVPMGKYVTEIAATDHNEAVSQIARLHPDEMTAREADAFREAQKAATEPKATPADELRQTVAEQLHDAGFERSTAESYAKLYEHAFGTLAERAGLDPLELYKRYGLNIRRATLEAPAAREGQAEPLSEPFPKTEPINGELPHVPPPMEKGALDDIRRELIKLGLVSASDPWGEPTGGTAESLDSPVDTGPRVRPLPEAPKPSNETAIEGLRKGLIEHGLLPPERFTQKIEAMKRRQADWVQSVSDTFGADGIVRTVNEKAGVEHIIHESTQEPGKFQVTTLRDGVPEGHFNVASIADAAKELIGDTLGARATMSAHAEAGQAAGSDGGGDQAVDRSGRGLSDGGREPVAAAAGGAVVPGSGGSSAGGGRTVPIPDAYVEHFGTLAADARRNGFSGSDDSLADIFNERLAEARDIARQLAPDDIVVNEHHDLLSFIAEAGGLGIEAEGESGMVGELEHLLENLSRANKSKAVIKRGARAGTEQAIPKAFRRSGGIKGIPGIVKRSGGRTVDNILEAVNEDGRFGEIGSMADFLVKIEDAIRIETGQSSAPEPGGFDVAGILDGALKVREGERWWGGPVDMLGEAADDFGPDGLGDEATSFDIRQFDQRGLFDPPETPGPKVDLLSDTDELPRMMEVIITPAMKTPRMLELEQEAKAIIDEMFPPGTPERAAYDQEGRTPPGEDAPLEKIEGLTLHVGDKVYPVDNYAHASEGYGLARDRTEVGSSEAPTGFLKKNGKAVGYVAYNGRVFEGTPQKWTPKTKMLYDPLKTEANMDRYITGEKQPRLPGDVGKVRDQEVKTAPIAESQVDAVKTVIQQLEAAGWEIGGINDDGTLAIDVVDRGFDSSRSNGPSSRRGSERRVSAKAQKLIDKLEAFPKEAVARAAGLDFELTPPPSSEAKQTTLFQGSAPSKEFTDAQATFESSEGKYDEAVKAYKIAPKRDQRTGGKAALALDAALKEHLAARDVWDRAQKVERLRAIAEEQAAAPQGPKQTTLFQGDKRELTPELLGEFVKNIREALGDDLHTFNLRLTNAGDISLSEIAVSRGAARAGIGSAVMQSLTKFADENGVRIQVSPANRGWSASGGLFAPRSEASTGYQRLVSFYKRFGFVENKGMHADDQVVASMYRDPTIDGRNLGQPFFHGTPHNVDKFSTSKIGTGEGAQAFGHGLYFAEDAGIAEGYRARLAGESPLEELKLGTLRVREATGYNYSDKAHVNDVENVRASLAEDLMLQEGTMRALKGDIQQFVLDRLDEKIADYKKEWPEGATAAEKLRAELAKPGAVSARFGEASGGVYKVDIPDSEVERFLDWDKPIGKQPEHIQQAIAKIVERLPKPEIVDNGEGYRAGSRFIIKVGDQAIGASNTLEQAQANADEYVKDLSTGARSGGETYQVLANALAQLHPVEPGGRFEDGQRQASELLMHNGVRGIKYLDANSRAQGEGSRNVVVIDDSIIKITHKDGTPVTQEERDALFQSAKPGDGKASLPQAGSRRGSIRFGPDRQFNIDLLERADLSTFLHESGHFYLEVFGDVVKGLRAKDAAGLTDTQRTLLADYGTVLEHIGATEGVDIPTSAHEKFAREFEAYLMDGKAPAEELRPAFARFRAWLLGVYQSVKNLHVNMTPEVRAVFDRMLATDAAIADAQKRGAVEPMFATAADAGMSPDEFKLYSDTIAEASRTAREQLETKLMSEVQRERTAQWREQRETIRKKLTLEAHDMPEYRALAAIRKGQNPDGTPLVEGLETEPLKLSKQILIDRYGPDRLARLPKPAIYTVEGGLDPDMVAERFGFTSGDDMLTAIENAPPLKQLIDQATQQHMIAEHGSILLDGSLHEKAEQAVANTKREEVIKSELRALAAKRRQVRPFVEAAGTRARQTAEAERAYERRWLEAEAKLRIAIAEGHQQVIIDRLTKDVQELKAKARGGAAAINRALPPDAVLKQIADERIGATVIHNLRPEVFWSASRRASKEATAAAARQDLDGAITAKQQELLNVHLFRAATDAREDVDGRVRAARDLVQKGTLRATIGKAGESFLEQIDGILERYDFAPINNKRAKERATLRKWAASMEGEGLPVDFTDEQLDDIRRTSFTELTYDELTGVSDALTHLVHLSRLKNKELKAEAGRELSAITDSVKAGIKAHKGVRADAQAGRDRSAAAEKFRVVAAYFAQHRKISSLAREIDGGEDNGPMWEHVIRPLNAAGDKEAQMFGEAAKRFGEAVERAFPGREKGKLYDRTKELAVGRSMSKMERLMIALNWGNEGNRQRIRSSEKWTDQQVRAVLAPLDARDWQFVQDVWDQIDSYWPEIAAKQKRVTGIEPKKVDAAAVETPFGTFRGGYFPLKYDDRLSPQAGTHLDLEGANIQKAAAYVKSTTRRGHTVERLSKVTLPVRYDFGVITEHLNQVIHDLSHHETLVDVQRVLADRGVQQAMYERYGDLTYQQFKDALRDIALGVTPQRPTSFGKALNYLRNGTTISALGYNLTTALFQPLGLSQSIVRIGPKWVAKGVAKWATDAFHMENSAGWIREQSVFMANRGKTQQREIAEIRNRVVDSTGKVSGWIDATLRGATLDHLTKADVADSYFYLIEKMQQIADIPTWLGQYEKSRAGGAEHERAVALADQAVIDAQSSGQIKDLAAIQRGDPLLKVWTMFYSYMSAQHQLTAESYARTSFKNPKSAGRFAVDMLVLYSVPSTLMYFIKNAVNPVDDKKVLGQVVRENIASLFDSMIGTRELGGIIRGQDYTGPSGSRAFVALGRSIKQIGQGETDAAFWRALNDTAGVLFQYPSTQVWRTLEGIAALSEGKTKNPLVLAQGYKSGAGNK